MNKLWINRNLGLILCGKFISEVGDKFYALALAYWVLKTTGSPSLMGLVLFSSMVPAIIMGFFIGAVIDRVDRKTLLVAADVTRGLIVAAVVAVYYLNLLSLPVIFTAQILLSICSAFFDPALQSVIPQTVEREQLAKANSMSSLVGGVALIIGPALGGLCVAYIGYAFVFIANAVSFIISALFKAPLKLPAIANGDVREKRYQESIREGYRYILGRKKLLVLIAVVALVHFFVGSVQVIIPVLAAKLPGDGAQNLGYLQTFFGVGVVATALLLSMRKDVGGEARFMFWGIAGTGLVYLAFGALLRQWTGGVFPYLVIFLLLSSAVIVISTNYQTIVQKNTDADMAGRVFSVMNALGDSSIPIAMLVFGFLLDYMPWYLLIGLYGVIILFISVMLLRAYGAGKAEQAPSV